METNTNITVDGKQVSLQELQEMQSNPSIKLKKVQENVYVTLQKLHG